MIRWKTFFREPEQEQILIPIAVLKVIKPKILLIQVDKSSNRQYDHESKHKEAKHHIGNLTTISTNRIAHIMKLNQRCPYKDNPHILPNLIPKINNSLTNSNNK